jgi:hypothetical protein
MSAFLYAPALSARDDGNHPPGTEPHWQESSLVAFADPARRLAGFHRIGIHPNRATASIYSWTMVDGRIVSCAKRTGLPMPGGPVTATILDGVCYETPEPLRTCRIRVDRDDVQTDVLFESYTGPVAMNMDGKGASIGKGHYDSLGRVTGTITAEGTVHPFDGVGFLDHSWGARDGSSILAHRWIMAARDAANHINTFPAWGAQGRFMLGYMVLDGAFAYVADITSEFALGDDHLGIAGVSATVTDTLGRRVTLTGRSVGDYALQPYGEGYFCTHTPMTWDVRGETWNGMAEFATMRVVPPWWRERLGIAADDEWLRAPEVDA